MALTTAGTTCHQHLQRQVTVGASCGSAAVFPVRSDLQRQSYLKRMQAARLKQISSAIFHSWKSPKNSCIVSGLMVNYQATLPTKIGHLTLGVENRCQMRKVSSCHAMNPEQYFFSWIDTGHTAPYKILGEVDTGIFMWDYGHDDFVTCSTWTNWLWSLEDLKAAHTSTDSIPKGPDCIQTSQLLYPGLYQNIMATATPPKKKKRKSSIIIDKSNKVLWNTMEYYRMLKKTIE